MSPLTGGQTQKGNKMIGTKLEIAHAREICNNWFTEIRSSLPSASSSERKELMALREILTEETSAKWFTNRKEYNLYQLLYSLVLR
jgi:hypothetical protein